MTQSLASSRSLASEHLKYYFKCFRTGAEDWNVLRGLIQSKFDDSSSPRLRTVWDQNWINFYRVLGLNQNSISQVLSPQVLTRNPMTGWCMWYVTSSHNMWRKWNYWLLLYELFMSIRYSLQQYLITNLHHYG